MHKSVFGICLILAVLAGGVWAQDVPKVELFGGYSYLRGDTSAFGTGFVSGVNLNGWEASANFNANKWFGIKADFDGHYGSPNILSSGTYNVDMKFHTFLFGPQLSHRSEKVTAFAHGLFGAAHVKADAGIILAGTQPRAVQPRILLPTSDTDTALAMAFGGGFDWNVKKNFAIRVIQGDYLMTKVYSDTQNNFRLSTGIVLRW